MPYKPRNVFKKARAACRRADAAYDSAVAKINADYREAVAEEFGGPFDADKPVEEVFIASLEKPIVAWKKAMDDATACRRKAYREAMAAFKKARFRNR